MPKGWNRFSLYGPSKFDIVFHMVSLQCLRNTHGNTKGNQMDGMLKFKEMMEKSGITDGFRWVEVDGRMELMLSRPMLTLFTQYLRDANIPHDLDASDGLIKFIYSKEVEEALSVNPMACTKK
jgi:hypothetical protein